MASFLNRLKGSATPSSPGAASAVAPVKKDPHAPQPTPLEKLLLDAGPIRPDGSDKFFGFENFGSTCYCNSIIQCLYYSTPFREQVINFPTRSPADVLNRAPSGLPRLNTDVNSAANGAAGALSPTKQKQQLSSPQTASPRKSTPTSTQQNQQGPKPEENKDSPEYKKKQAMAAGPILNMDYENAVSYGMSESLFTSLKDIFEAIIAHRSRVGVVSPNKFLEILRRENEMFRTAMHQDAHEFLNLLLNQVVESVEQFSQQSATAIEAKEGVEVGALEVKAAASNIDWVHELFEGTLTSETRCLTCENTSQRDEVFLDLSVDLEQHSSVTSCLRKFSEEEMLCERNKFHCDNCGGLQEAEKRMKIKRLPRILALHLKRFKYTEDLQRLQKLFHRVVYPYYLRLFNTTDDADDPDRLYELYAVVVHIGGGPYHGHYVSIIKTQDRGWLLFDDEMVEPVDKSYVRNFFGGENVLACAYVLFYQETTVEAMQREQEAEGLAAAKWAAQQNNRDSGIIATPNGKANGASVPNGTHNPIPIPPMPGSEELENYPNLIHATTAPAQPQGSPFQQAPLEQTQTSPNMLQQSKSEIKSGELRSKKERAREEKERKAAEKEAEKIAKQRRKEQETRRRDELRKQEEDLKAAIAASKLSKAAEDKERAAAGSSEGVTSTQQQQQPIPVDPHKEAMKENSGIMSGSLNRFRHSSMSLRHKPKFWSSKEKGEHEVKDATNAAGPASNASGTSTSDVEAVPSVPPIPTTVDQKSKGGSRFGLGRKKSNLLP
ncbi:hypothetical protein BDY21DRAFT_281268 [Lineolata rhizophorae]|uniref:Ubiquitin carboxyl-terminal hydrolase n=1 Tax=Lineolata rhizophorae TaxID=578093 RepID=A0A6A6P7K6_9PEZI|nr:hypothetical protein BDY21DRAFT_281268 [Lineolata rhizophorae]